MSNKNVIVLDEMPKFEIGQLVATRGIADRMSSDKEFAEFVLASLKRYTRCDWGDTCEEDKRENDYALKNGERLLAVYVSQKSDATIWIITEWDRSATTILLPEEY